MRTREEAVFRLHAAAAERQLAGLSAEVEQVDLDVAEDGQTIAGFAYYARCEDYTYISYALDEPAAMFDRKAHAAAFLSPAAGTVH